MIPPQSPMTPMSESLGSPKSSSSLSDSSGKSSLSGSSGVPSSSGSASEPGSVPGSSGPSSGSAQPARYYPLVRVSICWFNIWRHLNTRLVLESGKDIDAGDGLGPNAGTHSPYGNWSEEYPELVYYGSDVAAAGFPEDTFGDVMSELSEIEQERIHASYWLLGDLDDYAQVPGGGKHEDILLRFSAEWKPIEPVDNAEDWAELGWHTIGYVYFIAEVTRYSEEYPDGILSMKWIRSYVSSHGRPAATRRVSLRVFEDGFYAWEEDYGGTP